jgi:hypothetical protein
MREDGRTETGEKRQGPGESHAREHGAWTKHPSSDHSRISTSDYELMGLILEYHMGQCRCTRYAPTESFELRP